MGELVVSETTVNLLQTVCSLNTCIGNPATKFTELGKSKKNGQFLSANSFLPVWNYCEFASDCM